MAWLSRLVITRRWWVLSVWLLLAVSGGWAAPHAVSALSYDFSLPGQPGYETNRAIVEQFGSGGDNAPVLLVVHSDATALTRSRRPRWRTPRPRQRQVRG